MKLWPLVLLFALSGCQASQQPVPSQEVKAKSLTSLTNGVIGIRIGSDGLPESQMWVASKLLGVTPEPITAVPFPTTYNLLTESPEGTIGDGNEVPTKWQVLSANQKPSSNSLMVRLSGRGHVLAVEYTLHPTEPAFRISVKNESPGMVLVRPIQSKSPFNRRDAIYYQDGSRPVGDKFVLSQKAQTYEADFTLGDVDKPRFPKRLSVPHVDIEGDPVAEAAINGMMARLAASYRAGQCWGPFALTDGKYNGRAFWDLDVWIQPAMVFLDPQTAKKAAEWRISTLPQAKKNYDAWLKAGRPVTDKKQLADVQRNRLGTMGEAKPGGALFAWESAMDGTELSTAPTRFEHHISGSVALGLRFASDAGILSEADAMPVYLAAKTFYWARSYQEGEFHNCIPMTVSPDEWHVADNDLYTNELANWVHQHGQWNDPPYQSPTDGAFEGDEGKGYQQASALLAVWPLGAITDKKEIGKMYDRFAGKEAPQGPAMTKSLNALIAARLGRTDEAYKQWLDSWKLYTDDPALRFREKQKEGDGYFLTGAAGCVNAFLYGFLGLELSTDEPQGAVWKEKTAVGWVSLHPQLPKAWKSVKVSNISINGRPRAIEATDKSARVSG